MDIVICGAGEVGRHAAEVLSARSGTNVTIIDYAQEKLDALEELMDVRILQGSGTHANVLLDAGCEDADLFLAATNVDEINLLSASLAKSVGANRCIARVHHSAYFEGRGLDYAEQLKIDNLVCPEYSTATEIARGLRAPGALAVERFAAGRIEMQQLPVTEDAPALNKPLLALDLPRATRICMIERGGAAFIPDGQTQIESSDIVTLIGDTDQFERASRLINRQTGRRKKVIVMGGSSMGVWLCRTLRSRGFSVRLIESDRQRAEELAEKLDWVTVLRADPTDENLLEEERVSQADAFVALSDDDEQNILSAARAKSMGAAEAIAVLQRGTYLHLIRHVGIDRAFSPRVAAVSQMLALLDDSPMKHLASLDEGIAEVYEVHLPQREAEAINKPLSQITFPPKTMIAAVHRDDEAFVPGASDELRPGDTLVVIVHNRNVKELKTMFGVE